MASIFHIFHAILSQPNCRGVICPSFDDLATVLGRNVRVLTIFGGAIRQDIEDAALLKSFKEQLHPDDFRTLFGKNVGELL